MDWNEYLKRAREMSTYGEAGVRARRKKGLSVNASRAGSTRIPQSKLREIYEQ